MQLMTDYSKLIKIKYNDIGFEARQYQIDIINEILNKFIDREYQDVVLNAPTGSGKSVIGLITASCLEYINRVNKIYRDADTGKLVNGSYVLIHVNTLVDQYSKTIVNTPSTLLVMGAGNYDCIIHDAKADSCTFYDDSKKNKSNPLCSGCKYLDVQFAKRKMNNIVTNYSYYMSAPCNKKLVAVYDESHLLNEVYVNHNELIIDGAFIQSHLKIKNDIKNDDVIVELVDELKHVNKANYRTYVKEVLDTFIKEAIRLEKQIKELLECEMYDDDISKQVSKLKRKYKRVGRTTCIMKKHLIPENEHIPSFSRYNKAKGTDDAVKLSPIFVNNEIDEFNSRVKYRLYMSATNPKIYYDVKLGLESYAYLKMKKVFDPSTKKICMLNIGKITQGTLNESDVVKDKIINSCYQIINHHSKQKGVIHIPNFKIGDMIYEELRHDFKIYYQASGTKLVDVLDEFLDDDKPSLLMTPSGYEGLDLKYDSGRFQIIVKAPFSSLGDARIKYLSENYEDIYRMDTLLKVIQAGGRCTRAADDQSITYMLDNLLSYMFNNNMNTWRHEFQIVKKPDWFIDP